MGIREKERGYATLKEASSLSPKTDACECAEPAAGTESAREEQPKAKETDSEASAKLIAN